jgi:hypothetical protein
MTFSAFERLTNTLTIVVYGTHSWALVAGPTKATIQEFPSEIVVMYVSRTLSCGWTLSELGATAPAALPVHMARAQHAGGGGHQDVTSNDF